jgi:hypothetical protein
MKPNITQERLKQLLHYNPDTGKFTRLTKWGSQQIGDELGCKSKFGYRYIGVDGKGYTAYTLAWLYMYGNFPSGDIDHINRNPLDNRKANLRIATPSQNNANQDTSRKYKGAYKNAKGTTWSAKLCGKHLGNFSTELDAAKAYDAAAIQKYGEFAKLNFG